MDKIASFQINHLLLNPGIYVSRKDKAGDQILTTFDIRMTKPNYEPVMNTAEVHTIEHLGATFLRNNEEYKDRVIYFGPMGCRTGFYLILAGDYESKDIVELMISMFEFIRHYHDPIPGANPRECGNYLDMNLGMANYLAEKFLSQVLYDIRFCWLFFWPYVWPVWFFIIGSVQGQVLTNCMPGRKAGILMLWPPQRMELRLWPDMR